ncbi:MAG: hypothetical protein NT062_17640, partial [Proteobacteria bacterium]|nr:hypothetical protein [Pseudomonadota bacterium]
MQLFTRLPTALAILGVSTLAGQGAYVWQQPTGIIPAAPALEIPSVETADRAIDAVTHDEPIAPAPLAVPANGTIPFAFTMTVGGVTYVVMPNDDGLAPPTRTRLVVDDGVTSAIAPLARTALPAPLRAWFGRTFVVGERCHARVDGFAYVARLTGDPGYAGLDGETWSPRDVLAHGQHAIVARLDHVCSGDVARDATLAPMPTATVV